MYQSVQSSQSKRKVMLGADYNGFPVLYTRGVVITDYLETLDRVIEASLNEYPRTFAFRVDLRLPENYQEVEYDRLIERFISSFRKKVYFSRKRARKTNVHAPMCRVRYVWAFEKKGAGRPHYHFMFFLNHDAISKIGRYELGRDNTYGRLVSAWASALAIGEDVADGLVSIPNNSEYKMLRGDFSTIGPVFTRGSYLAKLETKQYGTGRHAFGASRG